MQVCYLEQPSIRRHKVASIEPDDVSGNQFRDEQFLLLSVANNGSSCGDLFSNLLHCMSSLELHEEVQQHA